MPPPYWLSGVNIVDPEQVGIRSGHAIYIVDGEISDIVAGAPTEEGHIIRCDGKYVVPGLIDMHVHCTADPAVGPGKQFGSNADIEEQAARNLATALAAGVTTVRDLGADMNVAMEVRRQWATGVLSGARPLVAGPMVTTVGGHGAEPGVPFGVEVRGVPQIRRLVRELMEYGIDTLKLVTCGASTDAELTVEELEAAANEAHSRDIPVAVHAHFDSRSIANGVRAGCDTLEHGCALQPTTAEEMATRGMVLCPTITVLDRIVASPDRFGGEGSRISKASRTADKSREKNFRNAMKAGVVPIAGTDAGMTSVYFNALHTELERMVDWGLTAGQALAAATTKASAALKRPDLGRITSGAKADILVLDRNPLETIRNLRSLSFIVQNGRVISDLQTSRRIQPAAWDGWETSERRGRIPVVGGSVIADG